MIINKKFLYNYNKFYEIITNITVIYSEYNIFVPPKHIVSLKPDLKVRTAVNVLVK